MAVCRGQGRLGRNPHPYWLNGSEKKMSGQSYCWYRSLIHKINSVSLFRWSQWGFLFVVVNKPLKDEQKSKAKQSQTSFVPIGLGI